MTFGVPFIGAGPLESELRALTGSAAHEQDVWTATCLLSGWGPDNILSCAEVAERTGRPVEDLRPLTRSHVREGALEAPVRRLATERGRGTPEDRPRLPRPFESWFEVEVFLFLEDHGYRAQPQEHVGRCRAVFMVSVAEGGPFAVECAGAQWLRGDRAGGGDSCEHERLGIDCRTVRVLHSEWIRRPVAAQTSLLEALGTSGQVRSAG